MQSKTYSLQCELFVRLEYSWVMPWIEWRIKTGQTYIYEKKKIKERKTCLYILPKQWLAKDAIYISTLLFYYPFWFVTFWL